MDKITGALENIVYFNEKNNYTVADFDVQGQLVTVVGYFPQMKEGENLTIYGRWTNHQDYGRQFKAESYEIETPTSLEGIERYLSSGILPGIGKKKARTMIDHFGSEILDIIQSNPEKLTEIQGIGPKTASNISKAYEEQRELREIMLFLQEFNISTSYAFKLFKKYKGDTIQFIKDNPYKMIEDIHGIGFKTADMIAMKMGIEEGSPYRIKAGIKYCLQKCYTEGHTYMTENKLLEYTSKILNVSSDFIDYHLMELSLKGEIKIEIIEEKNVYYNTSLFRAEENVANIIVTLANYDYEIEHVDIDKKISEFQLKNNIELDNNQKKAVVEAMNKGFLIITGGPGTGKTTIINSILEIMEDLNYDVILAAPTGRAAKRMTEATGREAKTIHRLLEYGYSMDENNPKFERNEDNPLEADVIIIDEASMVDILLMSSLLKAISLGTRLILVGDVDQLPSVGPGNVLNDLIESNVVKVVMLDKIFRQAQESLIVVNAHRINNGEYPMINEKDKDFFFQNIVMQEKIVKNILELSSKRLQDYKGYHPIEDVQVITPMKKSIIGVIQLNEKLQEALNPPSPSKNQKVVGNIIFREGDKVMQTKNNYTISWVNIYSGEKGKGVYNGDIGNIEYIDTEKQFVTVVFSDDKRIKYDFKQLDELMLSYAITVHKSQGSEFPVVIMPISWGPPMLLTRNLLYTAITRAKELVILVGQKRFLEMMISNNKIDSRMTGLKQRIQNKLVVFSDQIVKQEIMNIKKSGNQRN